MRRRVSLISGAALALLSLGQVWAEGPDFSGTWVLDKTKSDPVQTGQGRRNRAGADAGEVGLTLVVEATDTEIRVTRKMSLGGRERTTEQKYNLDGTETAVSDGRRGEIKGKARRQGNALVIEGTQKTARRGDMEIKVRDEWSLSDDGKILTIKSTRSGRRGDITSKQVFTKA
jgi:hypothetical protein